MPTHRVVVTLVVLACAVACGERMPGVDAAGCERADAPAHVVRKVVPELPRAYRGIGGVVQVAVKLDSAAHIRSASVYRSTNRLLDASALRSTLATRFAPEIVDCRPRGGVFRYIVAFHSPPIPWTKAARRDSRPKSQRAAK